MPGAQVAYLPDRRRLHLHHGPIDLIVDAHGPGREAALRCAVARFDTLLEELVDELDDLRKPVVAGRRPTGAVGRAMFAAVAPYAPLFVTPMAAVAGAVADEILRVMVAGGELRRAHVNNGGDVALHLAPGETLTGAIAGGSGDRMSIAHDSPVRGIASSGWRGRSQSLGIADAVTVLARTAAQADAAATLIANAVDLPGHPGIRRAPARDLAPDSDLGDRPVTVAVVAPLAPGEVAEALDRGARFAETCLRRGLIRAALLTLNGARRHVGAPAYLTQSHEEPLHA